MNEFEKLIEALADLIEAKTMDDIVPDNITQTVRAQFDAYIDARIAAAAKL